MFTLSALTCNRRTAEGALRAHAGSQRERERERGHTRSSSGLHRVGPSSPQLASCSPCCDSLEQCLHVFLWVKCGNDPPNRGFCPRCGELSEVQQIFSRPFQDVVHVMCACGTYLCVLLGRSSEGCMCHSSVE